MGYEELPLDLPADALNHRAIAHVNLHEMHNDLAAVPDGQSPIKADGIFAAVQPASVDTDQDITGAKTFTDAGGGLVLEAPDGSLWRITVDSDGNLGTEDVTPEP